MAVTALHLTTSNEEDNLTSYPTASISPSGNKLILAVVGSSVSSGTPNTPTLTGNGLTWVEVASIATTVTRITVFRAMGASPSAGAVTIDFAAQTQSRCFWSISEFDGVDTGGANGENAVVQSATGNATSGTSLVVTLAAFGSATNAAFGGLFKQTVEAITEGSGFTELAESQGTGLVIQSEWKDSEDTSVDWSWATAATRVGGIAVEIKELSSLIKKIAGVAHASIKKISGVSIGSVKKVAGVT